MSRLPAADSFAALARLRAAERPDQLFARFLVTGEVDGQAERLTFGGLDRAARAIAARLQGAAAAPTGERALLLYPPGLSFVTSFFGCLYAGVVAVPAYPPDPGRLDRALPRLLAIAKDSGARFVLTTEAIRATAASLATLPPELAQLEWLATDALSDDAASVFTPVPLGPGAVAFLQYTSGSTGDPKGVRITHGNLLHNTRVIQQGFGHDADLRGVIWLPAYHDMGLIGGVLQPAALGAEVTLMSSLDFLRRPARWLQAVSRFRGTTSGGPDFAYRLCVQKVTDAELSQLDLSSWKVAFSGAEPVREDTLEAFAARFAPAGFRRAAFYPTYGLAESTLMVTGGRPLTPWVAARADADTGARPLVGCGAALEGLEIAVVDPALRTVAEAGVAGEIWVAGPSVADGYWNQPERSAETFGATLSDGRGPWLRTGDLGLVRDGQLFVTGRIKDLVIVRGRNVHPQDVEAAASAAHPAIRAGSVVAFGVDHGGEEAVAVVAEVNEPADHDAVIDAIRAAVGEALALAPATVALVRRGQVPKTSSGKLRRFAYRDALATGALAVRARFDDRGPAAEAAPGDAARLSDRIAAVVARLAGRSADTLDRTASLSALGLDSVRLVELTVALEEVLDRPVPTMTMFDHPTVDALAAFLSAGGTPRAAMQEKAKGDHGGVYVDLDRARARIDERTTGYQFDLERDVAWQRIGEPGLYMSSDLLDDLGVDVAPLRAHPEAWPLFQWAMALQVCATFELLELGILFFAHGEREALGASRSVALLCEEEEKHIQLFRRYARHLRAERPADAIRLDALAEDTYAFIRSSNAGRNLPSRAGEHYLLWLRILFFEEYTVHLHRRLAAADEPIQPAWLSAHGAHRREEQQHVVTDVKHLEALALEEGERRALSALFAHDMLRDHERQFALEGARRLVEERFAGVRVMRDEPGLAASCTCRLVRERVFSHTRALAPFFATLAELPPPLAPRAAREAAGVLLGRAGDAGGAPIAIVGMACRIPGGANHPDALWDLLVAGTDAITEVPPSRWDVDALYDPDPRVPGRMMTRWGGFLRDIEQFDPAFFGIAPREARSMDPQQRLLLETSWEAIEDAAVPTESLRGSRTGVYLGLCSSDYSRRDMVDPIDGWTVTGNAWSVAAGRISYLLGLHGPSLAVDTACSSGNVALHLAVQSLRRGESDRAVVGAANLILVPESTICFSALRAMSPVGRCKAFDASADGYVRSEAVVSFVLEPLATAIREGHRVHAVIRGTAVNQDGRSNGLTAPNGLAQQAVVREALADAGLTAADVGYVEAHGTGTGLGDPIELTALGEVMRAGHPMSRPVPIGSIKTNVGHSEGVSGLVGLLKAVLVLEHGAIPPHLHLATPTPKVDWSRLPLRIPTALEAWPPVGVPRVACVSAFGFGGTNAHVVLEEAPAVTAPAPDGDAVLVPLSGTTEAAVREGARALAAHLADHPGERLVDVGYTAMVGRTPYRWRASVVANAPGAMRAALDSVVVRAAMDAPRIAFLFTGQGAQHVGMGRALYERFAVFRAVVDRCAAVIDAGLPVPLRELVCDAAAAGRIDRTGCTQPALFALEVGVASLWRALGVEPAVLIGHSVGEIAAACFAGALSIEDGARLVAARGALMEALPEGGSMVSVAASEAVVREALAGWAGRIDVASVNAADQIVISGDADVVSAVADTFAARGVEVKRLVVSHAFHSPRMDAMLEPFAAVVAGLGSSALRVPLVANVDGVMHADTGAGIPASYWVRHARAPVRFADGLATALRLGVDALVEVGPQPVLLGLAARATGDDGPVRVASLRRGRGLDAFLDAVGRVWALGAPIDGEAVYAGRGARRVGLPTTRFQRQRWWLEDGPKRAVGGAGAVHPLVGAPMDVAGRHSYEAMYGLAAIPWLADHRVGGRVVVPAAALVEAMRAAVAHALGGERALADVRIEQALTLADTERRRVQCTVEDGPDGARVQVFSKQPAGWTRHAGARVEAAVVTDETVDVAALAARCPRTVDVADAYAAMAAVGLGYGPAFQGLREVLRCDDEVMATIALPAEADASGMGWAPPLLDAALQATAALLVDDGAALYVPVGFDRVRGGRLPATLRAHVRLLARGAAPRADLRLFDDDGVVVLAVDGLRLLRTQAGAVGARPSADGLYALRWTPVAAPVPDAAAGTWLVMGDGPLAHAVVGALPGALVLGLDADAARLDAALAIVDGVLVVAPDDVADAPATAAALVRGGVSAAQAIERARRTIRPVLVTRGAQHVDGAERARVAPGLAAAHAALWGLGRTWALEQPALGVRLVDLDPAASPGAAAATVVAELGALDREDQVAWRQDQRLGARLVEAIEPEETPVPDAPNDYLDIAARGRLDTLRLASAPRPSPGPGQVVIKVEAAGLNFRDVLNALGMYKGAAGPLGGECAGKIVALGAGVTHLAIGDAVMAIAPAAFGRLVVTDARLAVRRPPGLSAEEAATVPIAFATAWYGLFHLARLAPGERLLVHAAAGGVGMAAVQLALRAGAEVIGTASPGKQDVVRALGVRSVHDSRTLAFAAAIREETRGEGIDVVLNALTGAFIPESLSLLREGGRFLEMGKAEVWTPAQVASARPGASYRAFDLVEVDPDVLGRILRDVAAGLAAGELRALPRRVLPITRAIEAFRFMAQARHVGKVVLSRAAGEPALDGAWLVTGAGGAIGRALCRWLVDHGVTRLALVGRTPVPEADPWLAALRAAGASVQTFACDVADPAAVTSVVAAVAPVRGVVHAAGMLDDATLAGHDPARIARVLAPKAAGAWALHQATLDQPLHAFVLLSSAASWLGSAGQAAYAAGNAFLDGLARARRARGLPATSVAYGPWAEGGMADRLGPREQARLLAMGIGRIAPARGLASLGVALRRDLAEVAVLPVDRERLQKRLASALVPPLLSSLAGPGRGTGPSALATVVAALRDAVPKRRHAMLVEALRVTTAQALGLQSPDAVDPHKPLRDLGLDSLMAIDLSNAVAAGVDRVLPQTALFDYPTLDALARYLVDDVLGLAAGEGKAAVVEVALAVPEEDAMTLAEAARQLAEELRGLEELL